MRKIILIVGGIILAGLLSVILLAKDFDISISESEAQTAINEALEKGPIKHLGTEISVSKAVLDFRENNNARIDLDFDISGFNREAHIEGEITAGLRYNAPRIYLDNIEPASLEVELDENTDSKVNNYKIIAKDFLERQKKEALSDEARVAMDEVLASDGEKIKELAGDVAKFFFEAIPIYNLNDAGIAGSIASLALKEVQFTDDEAIVTMSPSLAAIKILTFIIFIALIGFALFANFFPLDAMLKTKEDVDPKG